MADKSVQDIFVDMITNVTYANGVLRIALARAGADNLTEPVAMMFLPGGQLTPFLNGLNEAGKNIATQIQERQGDAQKPAVTEESDDSGDGKSSAKSSKPAKK
jgi:hypothetical protein